MIIVKLNVDLLCHYLKKYIYILRQKLHAGGYTNGYIALDPLKVPSPNKYNNMKLDQGNKYTMRSKTKIIDKTMSIESQNNFPGAGRYQNPQALSPRGKYSVSKHKGTGATLFNPRRSIRFFQFSNLNPGPGQYEQITKMSDRGHYILSRTSGYGKRYFDKESRVVKFENEAKKNYIPGPGAYRSPSDFGHYDGDVYKNNTLSMYKTSLSGSQSKLNSTIRSSKKKL